MRSKSAISVLLAAAVITAGLSGVAWADGAFNGAGPANQAATKMPSIG